MGSAASRLRIEALSLEAVADQYKAEAERHYAEYERFHARYMDTLDRIGDAEDEAYRLERIARELA
jgi:hypothetical protein